jgi:bifunctional non-homologous end joining protein LigD
MSLERYRDKRDFTRTPEPSGDGAAGAVAEREGAASGTAAGAPVSGRFVVQRHRARNLHWDFRLEIDGVLASWAVPKGPTLDPEQKRGAYHVEDHPLDYFDFEGVIPAGQYGAGDVIVWDWGTWRAELPEEPGRSVAAGELKFDLFGRKLRGRFTIVRTGGRGAGRGGGDDSGHSGAEAWILIKKRDAAAVSGWDAASFELSVKTGRTNDEVRAGMAPPFVATMSAPESGDDPRPVERFEITGAKPAALPSFVEPMKAELSNRLPTGEGWLYELKWDGYRTQARVQDGASTFATRRGLDARTYFPELAGPVDWLAAREAIVDGEVVALDGEGRPDFHLLQAWRGGSERGARRGAGAATSARAGELAYEVFDLLHLDGLSLLDVPLETRKRLLRLVLPGNATVRYAGHFDDGAALWQAVGERNLEGVVAKRRASRYLPGQRTPAWQKVKRHAEQEFVVVGWAPRLNTTDDLGALSLAVNEDGALVPAGRVGTGWDAAERRRLTALLEPLHTDAPPHGIPRERGLNWVEPTVVVRVEFLEWPEGGLLRAASYRGLELDTDPASVVRERNAPAASASSATPVDAPPVAAPEATPAAVTPATPAELEALARLPGTGGTWDVAGRTLRLRNLDKVIFPADGIIKRELIAYYTEVAPVLLPYLRDRALTVYRRPDGIDKGGFWQKQTPGHAPEWVRTWTWPSKSAGEDRDYVVADSVATISWLAHEAAIDLHPSTFRIDDPARPTWALVDIDPGTTTTWEDVLFLARLYRTALDHVGVRGFPKVTGQRGIQVWIPVRPVYSFEQTRDWVLALSRAIASSVPELVSWEWEKHRREGLARLDFTQNASNKTLVAPYAVRPANGAPVSAPIDWSELDDPALRPNGWTIRTLRDRLEARGDLFAPALTLEQDLPPI